VGGGGGTRPRCGGGGVPPPPTPRMTAIACNALTRDFGDVRALDRLTLSVPEGSIFAFLGPNGAGKTTSIHLLLGIIEPTSGSARVLGFDPAANGFQVRRRCGALLEHTGLYERLSAEENLRFYARVAHLGKDETEERIRTLLTRFGLYERRQDLVVTWSRGMKQKLAIARALVHEPELVFLDEPTAGLDPEATVALRRDIAALGTTVFLTTHNLADVEKMATHVAVIRQGQLLDFGTPSELRKRAIRSHVTIRMQDREPLSLELPEGESVAPVVTRLVQEGAQIEEVRREEASLEDVFLHLVQSRSVGLRPTPEPPPESRPEAHTTPRQPVFRDIATVIRKELREITNASGSGASMKTNVTIAAVMLVICAILAALLPPEVLASPLVLVVNMIAFLVVLASVGDSFPGERERHTLETLLASALPDEALLLGKIVASVFYGWTIVMIVLMTVLIGANATNFPIIYPLSTLLNVLVATPLILIFVSAAGVLLCMRVATVRAAQPRLMGSFLGLWILGVVVIKFMPQEWSQQARATMSSESGRFYALLSQILIFAALDMVVLAMAMVRFRRSRLL
jgi:ABC-2 type transport system ATP-binding protein